MAVDLSISGTTYTLAGGDSLQLPNLALESRQVSVLQGYIIFYPTAIDLAAGTRGVRIDSGTLRNQTVNFDAAGYYVFAGASPTVFTLSPAISVSGGGSATEGTLNSVLNELKVSRNQSSQTFYDSKSGATTAYYVRREMVSSAGVVTIVWENLDGTVATPTIANLQSVSNDKDINEDQVTFIATAAGTGYAIGDILIHSFGINTKLASFPIVYSFWMNATVGAVLTVTPTNGTYSQTSSGVTDLAKVAGVTTAVQTGASNTGTQRVAVSTDSPGGAVANPSFGRIQDGTTTGLATVKAASTSSLVTDTAIVVENRPAGSAAVYPVNSTVAAGGTAQPGLAANANRRSFEFQNNSTSDLWIRFGGTAAINSGWLVKAGASYFFPVGVCNFGAVSVFGATTGQAYGIGEM